MATHEHPIVLSEAPSLASGKSTSDVTVETFDHDSVDGSGAPCGVHIVGSLPYGSFSASKDVFATLAASLPGRLKRIPDGELGERWYYINWQSKVFDPQVARRDSLFKKSDLPIDTAFVPTIKHVAPLGYDTAAIASYKDFVAARDAGTIPAGVRFQVSLPLPCEAVGAFVEPFFQDAVHPLYESRMIECVRNIRAIVPSNDLAIQWDIAMSVGFIETERGNLDNVMFKPWFDNTEAFVLEAAERVIKETGVDDGVSLGFHLCYGDIEHQHFVQPKDLGLVVSLANALNEIVAKNSKAGCVDWFHMPVPKDRTDDAYFEPLSNWKVGTETQLYLGLVHSEDLEGTKKRISTAKKHFPGSFGVATECGMGRCPTSQLTNLLEIARQVADPY